MLSFLKNKKNKGFTLVELLVVIAIIGVLASIVLASLNIARSKARDAKRKLDLKQTQNALTMYYVSNRAFPVGTSFSSWASDWSIPSWPPTINLYNGLVGGGYMNALPVDPINREGGIGNFLGDNAPTDQAYYYTSDGSTYVLGTNLENGGGVASNAGNYQITQQ
jgi:type II secretion system protein G